MSMEGIPCLQDDDDDDVFEESFSSSTHMDSGVVRVESREEVFDRSNPCYFPFLHNPNPPYFPFPWGEQRWLEWLETPMAKTPGPKKVSWADQGGRDPKKYKYVCGPLKSCLTQAPKPTVNRFDEEHNTTPVFYNEWIEYVRNTPVEPARPSIWSDLVQALKTRLKAREEACVEPVCEDDPEAQGKRVHWPDTVSLRHHLYFRPVEEHSRRERLNLMECCVRDAREVQVIRAEQLVKPGPRYRERAAMWITTRLLKLPTRPPAASPFKSCLKIPTPGQEQRPGPADTHSHTHTSSCELTLARQQLCEEEINAK